MSASYSPSLALTWTDRRPRKAWGAACLLLLIAFAEIAWRGYGLWALLAALVWSPLAWRAEPPEPAPQAVVLVPSGHQMWQFGMAEPCTMEVLPGAVLLPGVMVLHCRPVGERGRRFLWLWARDLGEDSFRNLRRWWLVYGQKHR